MTALILDIETIGEEYDKLDEFTKDNLTSWIKRESRNDTEYQAGLDNLKEGLGFSPLTGEIVAIGVLDYKTGQRAVYYQDKNPESKKIEEQNVKYEPMSESEMLAKFWDIAPRYDTFVTFNGYSFDIPYLMTRAAIHGIKPTVNLMTNRYLSMQRGGVAHIDLIDQLSFYGAMRKKGSLYMWTRAFGIASSKSEGVNGHEVKTMYDEGRYLDIARYNAADLEATKELYTKWVSYLKF